MNAVEKHFYNRLKFRPSVRSPKASNERSSFGLESKNQCRVERIGSSKNPKVAWKIFFRSSAGRFFFSSLETLTFCFNVAVIVVAVIVVAVVVVVVVVVVVIVLVSLISSIN